MGAEERSIGGRGSGEEFPHPAQDGLDIYLTGTQWRFLKPRFLERRFYMTQLAHDLGGWHRTLTL